MDWKEFYLAFSWNINRSLVFKQGIDPTGTLEKNASSEAKLSDVGSLFEYC